MTRRIVYLLEAVEINEENCDQFAGTPPTQKRMLYPFNKERAVRKSGESVV